MVGAQGIPACVVRETIYRMAIQRPPKISETTPTAFMPRSDVSASYWRQWARGEKPWFVPKGPKEPLLPELCGTVGIVLTTRERRS